MNILSVCDIHTTRILDRLQALMLASTRVPSNRGETPVALGLGVGISPYIAPAAGPIQGRRVLDALPEGLRTQAVVSGAEKRGVIPRMAQGVVV